MADTQPVTREDLAEFRRLIAADVARLLAAALHDPGWLASLAAAPVDDEPETDDERRAVQAAREDAAPSIPHNEVLREFGL